MNRILAIASLVLFGTLAFAQTGIDLGVGATADAVHYKSNWFVTATTYENFDLKDSTADTSGYVNSLYLGGLEQLATSTAGFNTYGGYVEVVPTKTLAKFVNSTNIPADSLRVYVLAGVGETVPNSGSAYITGFTRAGLDYAITSSGSVVWNTIQFGGAWGGPPVYTITSGLQGFFGGKSTTQSSKMAKLRRALHSKLARPVTE